MKFHSFGSETAPTVVLIHGAGLSWWAYEPVAACLKQRYRVVLPVIDGYGEASDEPFISIEASADGLIRWIDEACGGHVLALGGLSLGAQIAAEALSRRSDIAKYALLDSALVCPVPGMNALAESMVRLSYGLIRLRWFSRWQARAMCVPDGMFEAYYADSLKLSRTSLLNTLRSNAAYRIKPGLSQTAAGTLLLVGDREAAMMIRSASLLADAIPRHALWRAAGMRHGEFSLTEPGNYAALIEELLAGELTGDSASEPDGGFDPEG